MEWILSPSFVGFGQSVGSVKGRIRSYLLALSMAFSVCFLPPPLFFCFFCVLRQKKSVPLFVYETTKNNTSNKLIFERVEDVKTQQKRVTDLGMVCRPDNSPFINIEEEKIQNCSAMVFGDEKGGWGAPEFLTIGHELLGWDFNLDTSMSWNFAVLLMVEYFDVLEKMLVADEWFIRFPFWSSTATVQFFPFFSFLFKMKKHKLSSFSACGFCQFCRTNLHKTREKEDNLCFFHFSVQ